MELEDIGQIAVAVCLGGEVGEAVIAQAREKGYVAVRGKVGSMNLEKVVAAIETAAKREGVTAGLYREEHALYHAVLEALYGVCRGNLALGTLLRTVGLNFAIIKGPKSDREPHEGTWIAVAMYGTIGAPVKGWEHEAIGLGINHL